MKGVSNSLFGIQRMTSDCEDVRMLVQALAAKIELSWKVTSYKESCYIKIHN